MPTNTYVALDKVTVGTAVGFVTLTSISSAYTDLVLIIKSPTIAANYNLRFNGDTASNYSYTSVYGDGTSATSSRSSNNTVIGLTYTSSGAPVSKIQIQNYASTSFYKTVLIRQDDAANAAMATVGLWRKTPEAISSITIVSTGNIPVGATFSLYGITASANSTSKASGGVVTEDATYYYHTFGSSGTFTPTQSLTADLLLLAGGGGGGGATGTNGGGGGGAGGYRELSSQSLTATPYTITVGAGGAGGVGSRGTSGGNSSMSGSGFTTLTRTGGGGGGINAASNKDGLSGGSGGGAGATSGINGTGGAGNAGSYTPVEGYAGGNGSSDGVTYDAGGGGGGAGAVGTAATSTKAGNGGVGVTSSLLNAIGPVTGIGQLVSSNYYVAGGGGGGSAHKPRGTGGSGGGGSGTGTDAGFTPTLNNTGGGGAGGNHQGSSTGAGASGVVVIRYAK
jgi:hypothetical protein